MQVLPAESSAAIGHQGDSVTLLARSARRTNRLLIVLTIVLVALTALLADLALQLNEGNVSLGTVAMQKACGDAQQVADYDDAGQTLRDQHSNPNLTQEQSRLSEARDAAVEALAADAAGSGKDGFARAARRLAEEFLTTSRSFGSSAVPAGAPASARTVYDGCRSAGYSILSWDGANSLTP